MSKIIFRLLQLTVIVFIVGSCCRKVVQPTASADVRTTIPWMWKDINYLDLPVSGLQNTLPSQFRAVVLNTNRMKEELAKTVASPADKVKKHQLISLPLPEGGYGRYEVTETETMDAALLAKFPQLRTYSGKGVDEPTSTAKLDFMPAGFHGYLFTLQGSVIIQPWAAGDTLHYLCYYKHFASEAKRVFEIPADSSEKHK